MWAVIWKGKIIGPEELPPRLDGEKFLISLNDDLEVLLEDFPLDEVKNMWIQLDGAPAHFKKDVRAWLDSKYKKKWIGRSEPVRWPPRYPDLNPLDFFCGDI